MDNSNEIDFPNGPLIVLPWHFQTNRHIITKVKWQTSDHKNYHNKFGGSGITPSYFPTLMNMAIFGHFFTISLFIYETIHQKVFFKNFDQKFFHYEGFCQNYQRPGPFAAIPSICNERSLPRLVLKYVVESRFIQFAPRKKGFERRERHCEHLQFLTQNGPYWQLYSPKIAKIKKIQLSG